jgi:predicted nucleic acid-binding Zn ribbon protein
MFKTCPLCNTEMPERYNYCYQCGEYVGQTATLEDRLEPEVEQEHRKQERVIHYGCMTLIVVWVIFGLWFFFNMNR